jgi:hypothetical protein
LKVFIPSPRQHCLVEIIAYSYPRGKTDRVFIHYLLFYELVRKIGDSIMGGTDGFCHSHMCQTRATTCQNSILLTDFPCLYKMTVIIVSINSMQKSKNRDFTTKLEVIYDENARKRRERCVET